VVPVGASRPIKIDARVVAATHQPIAAMIERGEFRRDLFGRLEGFSHRLWPLRDRREDLGVLVRDILARLEGGDALRVSADAAAALVRHDWPLNVRELAQLLARGITLAHDDVLAVEHLPAALAALPPAPPAAGGAEREEPEEDARLRATLVDQLDRHEGNVTAVARDMKKAPMQIYRWMRRLGISPKSYR
jgi:DNA-binding NtrC family response regulator